MHPSWGFAMIPAVSGVGEWCAVLYKTFGHFRIPFLSILRRSFWLGTNILCMASMDSGKLISLDGGDRGDCHGA